MKKITILITAFFLGINSYGQSKILNPFTDTEIMGCSCFILEKNKFFEGNKYLGVMDFAGEWQDRKLEIKLGTQKLQLRIDNTNAKSNHFGLKKYFEVYKDDIYKIEIRIDYDKTKSVGGEMDLYNITLTIKYKGETERIITKGYCGC